MERCKMLLEEGQLAQGNQGAGVQRDGPGLGEAAGRDAGQAPAGGGGSPASWGEHQLCSAHLPKAGVQCDQELQGRLGSRSLGAEGKAPQGGQGEGRGAAALGALTRLVNVMAEGRVPKESAPFTLGGNLFALLNKSRGRVKAAESAKCPVPWLLSAPSLKCQVDMSGGRVKAAECAKM